MTKIIIDLKVWIYIFKRLTLKLINSYNKIKIGEIRNWQYINKTNNYLLLSFDCNKMQGSNAFFLLYFLSIITSSKTFQPTNSNLILVLLYSLSGFKLHNNIISILTLSYNIYKNNNGL